VEDEVRIRAAEPDDAEGLAHLWTEFGRYYEDIDPVQFRAPGGKGLATWFHTRVEEGRTDDAIWLVAESEGQLVGFIHAQIWPPSEDANRQLIRDDGEFVLRVDSLVVTEGERRKGIGKTLMDAVERWAKERGASVSFVVSYAHSPTSVPFYEDGMGYARKTIGFWKRLEE
jgi:GNAT superfamily N-acetyltransferase